MAPRKLSHDKPLHEHANARPRGLADGDTARSSGLLARDHFLDGLVDSAGKWEKPSVVSSVDLPPRLRCLEPKVGVADSPQTDQGGVAWRRSFLSTKSLLLLIYVLLRVTAGRNGGEGNIMYRGRNRTLRA